MTDAAEAPRTTDVTIGPGDKRYPALNRGFNQRWIAEPEYIRLARSGTEVAAALAQAVKETPKDPRRTRITVRSGGHSYEDFVCGDDVRVIIDVGPMCGVGYDPKLDAHYVEAGATNWHVYSHLYPLTGKALPGGSCYSVGVGGHVTGGGFGLLSRQHGLTVDYLYAVEVAVVKKDRTVELVVAKRDDPDPARRELLWAHTGAGGGNFGVVTRFWFRGLPEPPKQVLLTGLAWKWAEVRKEDFTTLVRKYGEFFQAHKGTGDKFGNLFSMLKLNHVSNGEIGLIAQIDADTSAGTEAMGEFLAAIDGSIVPLARPMTTAMGEHPPIPELKTPRLLPWLTATQVLNSSGENRCGKYKSAYHRTPFTTAQIEAMWAALSDERYENKEALIQVDSYGAAINKPPRETAVPQRDSIMKLQHQVYWTRGDSRERQHLAWIRKLYRSMYTDTGGVPVPNQETDGCYINYPDVDLNDTATWNTSGVPWSTLYYKGIYPRLRQVKKRWDPLDVFRNKQSIELPPERSGQP
ncbi:hypothetical protein HDA32_002383 [Spinactinospora alkalitolerans]|uniref:FAD-binding PCMH-type domain-containing protein n=1 Tax=Spinactinospora alkalitolerans TaxID=687207 RepID=A0A852TWP5_9ACTN|nr:BBE domain-containing protein [Spinactinospora alkalitolerans]NYE47263.1 hypothetical protein [Spinactinospora alkalitolerans]